MKRLPTGAMVVAVVGVLTAMGQVGCVSQSEYDKLLASERACNADRQEMNTQLREARAKLAMYESQQGGMSAILADKDQRIADLTAQAQAALDQSRQLQSQVADLQMRLAQQKPPTVVVQEGDKTEIKLTPKVHEALKNFVATHPGLIEYDEKLGLVRFSTDLLFASGSYEVQADQERLLGDFAEVVKIPEAVSSYDVLVVGHTDNVKVSKAATKARTPTNWHLSVFRAVSVLEVMANKGVNADRMGAMGFGAERPRVPNNASGGTKENRRVEVFLVPKGSLTLAG